MNNLTAHLLLIKLFESISIAYFTSLNRWTLILLSSKWLSKVLIDS